MLRDLCAGSLDQTPLKRDNITPEEVVEVIKDYRAKKIEYKRYQEDETNAEQAIKDKLTEFERIFSTTSNEMEWEEIRTAALKNLGSEKGLRDWDKIKKWVMRTNNFLRLGRRIISLAEQGAILQEYTTLNDDFTKD
ncbi:hypothetical protein GLOIN_2v1784816 [Rhizophagus irregularis DAOM 181602=DAOM 197198]|nr:hypothetical protein GLOIN_2v1784816 [Rhizophagus irregularis DAOM 181602=DAOM 197198]